MDRCEGWSGRRSVRCFAVLFSCTALGLTFGVAALLASSAPSFSRARSYVTGTASCSVAIGDLNSDGRPDLAIANAGENPVSVLLNRGDGRFQARREYQTGSGGSVSVAIGDLNGDGKPEIATANASANTVSVFLNRGDGSFQMKRDYGTGRRPFSVAIGDLNGDGKADLAIANGRASTVSVLLNRGDGSFQPKLDYRTGGDPGSVAIGDLNGDGKLEIATANDFPSSVSVLLNEGDGSFRARRNYATGGGPHSIAIGDLNGDGKADLATANINGTVSALVNKGDGGFQAKLDYTTGQARSRVPLMWSVAIGDLNGDRQQDLAAAGHDEFDGTGTVSVLLNKPGLCSVQNVHRMTLATAERTIARANCRVGKIRRAYSTRVKKGRVISQKPSFGAVLPGGSKVNLVVSRGRKPS